MEARLIPFCLLQLSIGQARTLYQVEIVLGTQYLYLFLQVASSADPSGKAQQTDLVKVSSIQMVPH